LLVAFRAPWLEAADIRAFFVSEEFEPYLTKNREGESEFSLAPKARPVILACPIRLQNDRAGMIHESPFATKRPKVRRSALAIASAETRAP